MGRERFEFELSTSSVSERHPNQLDDVCMRIEYSIIDVNQGLNKNEDEDEEREGSKCYLNISNAVLFHIVLLA